MVEHLFRALTDINADGQAIRFPQTFAALVATTGSDEAQLRQILAPFRAPGVSFISPYDDAPIDPHTLIDVSHEALIRCWQSISGKQGWLQKEFQDGLIWKSLGLAAEEGGTLSGTATTSREPWLEALPSRRWCERYGGGWTDVQRLMERSRIARDEEAKRLRELDEARAREAEERARRAEEAREAAAELARAQEQLVAEQRQRAEAERQRAADAEIGRRKASRLAAAAGTFALLALIAASAAFWYLWQADQAKQELQEALTRAETALARATTAETEAQRARKDAQLGDTVFRSFQARSQLSDGLPVSAMQLALEGLPKDLKSAEERPWFGEPAGALVEAMGEIREQLVLRGHEGAVWAAGFSPDGARIVSGSDGDTLRVWDAKSGDVQLVLRGREGSVLAAGFSPDGARIVSGSSDNTLRVWDAKSGDVQLVLRGHEGTVWAAGFSPDGGRIVSGSDDNPVRVTWIGRSKQELIDTARARLPRELTPEERRRFYLAAQ